MTAGSSPDPRNLISTLRTLPIVPNSTARHVEPRALDHRLIAMMTSRVFPLAYLSGKISRVHVFQPCALPVLKNAHEIVHRRPAIAIRHLVVGMKRRHVPGHQRVDAGDEV